MKLSSSSKKTSELTHLIQQAIQSQGGPISFKDFMEFALYTPNIGYYTSPREKFGKSGDFITAPLVSSLFGKCLALQIKEIFSHIETPDILEIGAGNGKLACDILLALEKENSLPAHYFILEKSEYLRDTQKHFLKETCPHLFSRIFWLDSISQIKITGVILANEVMDALPFHCFAIQNDTVFERAVTFENEKFSWQWIEPFSLFKNKITEIKNTYHLQEPYASEICLQLPEWIKSLANSLAQGVILLLDYGYGRAEYFHPERFQGTLTCFYEHQKHQDPFMHIGSQDITAHVDFTSIVESAIDAGLTFQGYTTQAAFLFASGLLELAAKEPLKNEVERFQQSQAIKTLTLPSEMGETIKVMALGKDFSKVLQGFSIAERSRDL